LVELLARSLICVDADGEDLIYRLSETTRACCLAKLRASGDEHEARQRHAEHVCSVLERATTEWSWRSALEWGAEYGRVLYDLRAALASIG
jgi:predicted ATPase